MLLCGSLLAEAFLVGFSEVKYISKHIVLIRGSLTRVLMSQIYGFPSVICADPKWPALNIWPLWLLCVKGEHQGSCPVELSVVGRSLGSFQKQLSAAASTARCGLDTRLGPCRLHGVLRSNTRPPHYRPGGSFSSAHTLALLLRTAEERISFFLTVRIWGMWNISAHIPNKLFCLQCCSIHLVYIWQRCFLKIKM